MEMLMGPEGNPFMYAYQVTLWVPNNPFLALIQKSRDIWICHCCIDKLKGWINSFVDKDVKRELQTPGTELVSYEVSREY